MRGLVGSGGFGGGCCGCRPVLGGVSSVGGGGVVGCREYGSVGGVGGRRCCAGVPCRCAVSVWQCLRALTRRRARGARCGCEVRVGWVCLCAVPAQCLCLWGWGLVVNGEEAPPWWGLLPVMVVRRCPTLPHSLGCSTIGAVGLSFRVRNGTGRFPHAMTAVTLATVPRPPGCSCGVSLVSLVGVGGKSGGLHQSCWM